MIKVWHIGDIIFEAGPIYEDIRYIQDYYDKKLYYYNYPKWSDPYTVFNCKLSAFISSILYTDIFRELEVHESNIFRELGD